MELLLCQVELLGHFFTSSFKLFDDDMERTLFLVVGLDVRQDVSD